MRNEELRYSYVTSNDWENDEFNGEVYIKMWINKINIRKIDRFDRLVYKNEYFDVKINLLKVQKSYKQFNRR